MTASVSVIIPVHNRSAALRRALSSLSAQTCKDFEVIVCDDGSDEDIRAVAQEFEGAIDLKYVRIEASGSPSRPRNVAIKTAQHEWISFLDSDDWWEPTRLAEMRPFLADNDIVYHKLEVVSATPRRKSKTKYVGRAHRGRLLRYLIADGNPFATSASMVRRSLLLDNGGMWEAPRGDAIDDFDLWLRLASDARLRVRFVDRRLGFYEVSGVNISASSRQKYIRYRRLFRRQLAILPGMYRTLANSHFEYILGRYALKLGMDDRAILHLRRVRLDVSPGKFLSAWMRIAIVRIGTLINCHRIE